MEVWTPINEFCWYNFVYKFSVWFEMFVIKHVYKNLKMQLFEEILQDMYSMIPILISE